MASEMNPTTITDDGLVLKNTGMIEDIITRLEHRADVDLVSWQISRILRRDYNIVSKKMFIRCRDRNGREQVRGLIEELMLQAEMLRGESLKYEAFKETHPLVPTALVLRVVSPETMQMLKALLVIDQAIGLVKSANIAGHVDKSTMEAFPVVALKAYTDVKQYVMGTISTGTATELAREQGVT
jgi:hypothetical protein